MPAITAMSNTMNAKPQYAGVEPVEISTHNVFRLDGKRDRMLIMMMRLIPFPIPFSVMRSPNHIKKIVPVVNVTIVVA